MEVLTHARWYAGFALTALMWFCSLYGPVVAALTAQRCLGPYATRTGGRSSRDQRAGETAGR